MKSGDADEYVLSDDEYEILETGNQRQITSEEVKKKLENPSDPFLGPIEQEDFDKKGYTLLDYLKMDEDTYPRKIRGNGSKAVAGAMGIGLYSGAEYLAANQLPSTESIIVGFAVGSYLAGLNRQEMKLSEAVRNSGKEWSQKFSP